MKQFASANHVQGPKVFLQHPIPMIDRFAPRGPIFGMTLGKDPYMAQRIARALRGTYVARQDQSGERPADRQVAKPGRSDALINHLAVFSPVATLGKKVRR